MKSSKDLMVITLALLILVFTVYFNAFFFVGPASILLAPLGSIFILTGDTSSYLFLPEQLSVVTDVINFAFPLVMFFFVQIDPLAKNSVVSFVIYIYSSYWVYSFLSKKKDDRRKEWFKLKCSRAEQTKQDARIPSFFRMGSVYEDDISIFVEENREKLNEFSMWEQQNIVFENVKKLGVGTFGSVYRINFRGQIVAIKIISKVKSQTEFDAFLSELGLMVRIQHPSIIRFVGFSLQPKLMIIQEYAEHGEMSEYIWNSERKLTLKDDIYRYLIDIAKGLYFLHSREDPIVHMDIKAENVVITDENAAKIIDFGEAVMKSSIVTSNHNLTRGTPLFMAPEVMSGEFFDTAADVYSFGMLILQATAFISVSLHGTSLMYTAIQKGNYENFFCLFMLPPSWQTQKVAMKDLIDLLNNGWTPKIPSSFKILCPELYGLAKGCLEQDPKKRPTAPDIIHSLRNMDSLQNMKIGTKSNTAFSDLTLQYFRKDITMWKRFEDLRTQNDFDVVIDVFQDQQKKARKLQVFSNKGKGQVVPEDFSSEFSSHVANTTEVDEFKFEAGYSTITVGGKVLKVPMGRRTTYIPIGDKFRDIESLIPICGIARWAPKPEREHYTQSGLPKNLIFESDATHRISMFVLPLPFPFQPRRFLIYENHLYLEDKNEFLIGIYCMDEEELCNLIGKYAFEKKYLVYKEALGNSVLAKINSFWHFKMGQHPTTGTAAIEHTTIRGGTFGGLIPSRLIAQKFGEKSLQPYVEEIMEAAQSTADTTGFMSFCQKSLDHVKYYVNTKLSADGKQLMGKTQETQIKLLMSYHYKCIEAGFYSLPSSFRKKKSKSTYVPKKKVRAKTDITALREKPNLDSLDW